ncbi:retrovirus-related pol polyprotein from transposon tnt 1-94 [Lasius niger]|uniref:Retrovirus-related pol polyprotein from transposon tnt 1-94 n=1 Tax=Lasius niger TaxID=67767 RepID=A0A0J7K7F2_LASNI|nr:retrovirus-related pol polyprotein from transposon tnt 1-94 [Lasius niger]
MLKQWGIKVRSETDWPCEECALGKMSRKPFPTSQSQTKKPGDLIHMDLCGPMEHNSIEVTENFKGFLKAIEVQEGKRIKKVRTNNGLEFVNREMQEILRQNGIKHERSVAYTPEQNSAVERENRTVTEAARCMIYAKGTSSVPGKVPYELWFGKATAKLELKIFGTDVYTHIPKEKRTKWSPKAKKGVFVGYDENTKGYRVFFETESRVEICRDIKFLPKKLEAKVEAKERNETAEVQEMATEEDEEEPDANQQPVEHEEILEEEEQEPEDAEPDRQEEGERPNEEGRRLRNRENIRRPNRYNEYELNIENLLVAESKQPTTHQQAIQSKEAELWKKAMMEEIDSLTQK